MLWGIFSSTEYTLAKVKEVHILVLRSSLAFCSLTCCSLQSVKCAKKAVCQQTTVLGRAQSIEWGKNSPFRPTGILQPPNNGSTPSTGVCIINFHSVSPVGSPGAAVVKTPSAKAGDAGDTSSIPGSERSLEEEITIHFSILAWKIPTDRSQVGYSPQDCKSQSRLSMHICNADSAKTSTIVHAIPEQMEISAVQKSGCIWLGL